MKTIFAIGACIAMTVGLVKIFIFLFHQWGILGLVSAFTVVVPLAAPVWEWITTGHFITFALVYGGVATYKLCEFFDRAKTS